MGKRPSRGEFRTTDLLIQRLWNFGAYARQDPCKPEHSCENPLYQQFIPSKAWEEAWGEQVSADPGYEQEVDEADAEEMEVWLLQLPRAPRAVICQRFVLRMHVPHLDVDAAVRALADLMERHWAVIDKVEGR